MTPINKAFARCLPLPHSLRVEVRKTSSEGGKKMNMIDTYTAEMQWRRERMKKEMGRPNLIKRVIKRVAS